MHAPRVAVAYSGGRDSTALLRATLAVAGPLGLEVVALHVHHGLSAHADEWLAHCRERCRRWRSQGFPVTFDAIRLTSRPASGESIEAWARNARRAALAQMATSHGASIVLLAHHRRDQAETVLLQALRGAGPAGLAAMPKTIERHGIVWARPWLDQPAESVAHYANSRRLRWVEDDSNADHRYLRNRLRSEVWPTWAGAFPQAEAGLAAVARRAQEANECLVEMADADLAGIASDASLDVRRWHALSPARRANALRRWLALRTDTQVASTWVARLLDELKDRGSARWPLAQGELFCERGRLSFLPFRTHPVDRPAPEAALAIARSGIYRLPGWGGALRARRAQAAGIALSSLAAVELVARQGGERFQLGLDRPPRTLKKQFQLIGVPARERGGPLVYSKGRLLFVPGLGIDARAWAEPGEPQLRLEWIADAALS